MCLDNPTLPKITAVATDRPVCARLSADAPAGLLAASYTTSRDTTRGEDNPSHPRQGAQDCRVALLGILPRLGLRSGELFDQAVDPPRDGLDLAIDQGEALGDGRDVGTGRNVSTTLRQLLG